MTKNRETHSRTVRFGICLLMLSCRLKYLFVGIREWSCDLQELAEASELERGRSRICLDLFKIWLCNFPKQNPLQFHFFVIF